KNTFLKSQSKTKSKKLQDSDEELWERLFTPTLDSFMYEDEKDFQEHLKPGPLEIQLMCVVGRAMPIHKEPEEMLSGNHKENGISNSDEHITAQMIKALSRGNVGQN
ncbi:CCD83 protein, partial [Zapornia atra]|nr:CCD83 protein [Zapornia atra]